MTLTEKILKALAKSSSHKPVEEKALLKFGNAETVHSELVRLYNAHQVYSCQITKGGKTRTVWWSVGAIKSANEFLRNYGPAGGAVA